MLVRRVALAEKYKSTVSAPLPIKIEPTLKSVSFGDYATLFVMGLVALSVAAIAFLVEIDLSQKLAKRLRALLLSLLANFKKAFHGAFS